MEPKPPTQEDPKRRQCEHCKGIRFSEELADRFPLIAFCDCGTAHKIIKPSIFAPEDETDDE